MIAERAADLIRASNNEPEPGRADTAWPFRRRRKHPGRITSRSCSVRAPAIGGSHSQSPSQVQNRLHDRTSASSLNQPARLWAFCSRGVGTRWAGSW